MRPMKAPALAALAAALLFVSLTPDALAQSHGRQRVVPPARSQASPFKAFAQAQGMPHAVHNGKLYIKADMAKLRANYDAFARIGEGSVLEFAGTGHLHTRFNGKKDANFLSGLSIGTFSPPSYGKRVSVVVKLTDPEKRELNDYVTAASSSYDGARREIGSFNYNGGRPARYYPSSANKANCTTWISSAKLDGSRSLASALGVWEAASPRSWIRSLAQSGNERVQAVMLYNFEGDIADGRAVSQFVTEATQKH